MISSLSPNNLSSSFPPFFYLNSISPLFSCSFVRPEHNSRTQHVHIVARYTVSPCVHPCNIARNRRRFKFGSFKAKLLYTREHAPATRSRNTLLQHAPSCAPTISCNKIVVPQTFCSLIIFPDIKLVKCEGASSGSKLLHAKSSMFPRVYWL